MPQPDPFKSQLVEQVNAYLHGYLTHPEAMETSDLRMILEAFEDMSDLPRRWRHFLPIVASLQKRRN